MPSKTQSILIGALTVGILSTSYIGLINFACCLGVILGALVAVWHYTSTNSLTLTAGSGAGLGALAGVGGALIAAVLNYLLALAGLDATAVMNDWIIGQFGDQMQPEQIADMREQQANAKTIGGIFQGLLFSVPLFALFGAIGGAIGSRIFKKGPVDDTF